MTSLPPPPAGLDLSQNRGPIIMGVSLGTYFLAVLTVGLRFWCRRLKCVCFWWDDWLILVSLVPAGVQTFSVGIYAVSKGFGKHVWATKSDSVYAWALGVWIAVETYVTAMTLIKMSILAFFWRSFSVRKSIRYPIWGLAIINGIWFISGIILGVCQCLPPRAFWDRYHPTHPMSPSEYSCDLDPAKLYFWNSLPTLITDIMMLILPIPYIITLQLPLAQKNALAGVFLVGIFVTIATTVRIIYLRDDDLEDPDVTWNFFGVGIWSIIEQNIAIICACLPFLRPFLIKITFGLIGKTSSHLSRSHNSTTNKTNTRASTKLSTTNHSWDVDRRFGTTTTHVRAFGSKSDPEADEHLFVKMSDDASDGSLMAAKQDSSHHIEMGDMPDERRMSSFEGIMITREVHMDSNSVKHL